MMRARKTCRLQRNHQVQLWKIRLLSSFQLEECFDLGMWYSWNKHVPKGPNICSILSLHSKLQGLCQLETLKRKSFANFNLEKSWETISPPLILNLTTVYPSLLQALCHQWNTLSQKENFSQSSNQESSIQVRFQMWWTQILCLLQLLTILLDIPQSYE